MELDFENELDLKYLKFIKYYILSVECALLYFTILFYISDIRQLVYLDFFSMISVGYSYYLITKFIRNYKTLIKVGFYLFALLLYLHVLILAEVFPIMHSLFFLQPLAVYILTDYKTALRWVIVIFTLSVCATWIAPFLYSLFNINIQINITEQNRLIINYSFVGTCIYFVFFMLSFLSDFNTLKFYTQESKKNVKQDSLSVNTAVTETANDIAKEETHYNEEAKINYTQAEDTLTDEQKEEYKQEYIPISEAEIEKFEELYKRIVLFFEEKKPYKDPEYNINKLATSLDTNTTYVYRTLKYIKNTNFKSFLNNYRISEIKDKLNRKEHQRYTLKHIYNDSGFTHQATFNRIFKEIVGVTPSEYIEKLNT